MSEIVLQTNSEFLKQENLYQLPTNIDKEQALFFFEEKAKTELGLIEERLVEIDKRSLRARYYIYMILRYELWKEHRNSQGQKLYRFAQEYLDAQVWIGKSTAFEWTKEIDILANIRTDEFPSGFPITMVEDTARLRELVRNAVTPYGNGKIKRFKDRQIDDGRTPDEVAVDFLLNAPPATNGAEAAYAGREANKILSPQRPTVWMTDQRILPDGTLTARWNYRVYTVDNEEVNLSGVIKVSLDNNPPGEVMAYVLNGLKLYMKGE